MNTEARMEPAKAQAHGAREWTLVLDGECGESFIEGIKPGEWPHEGQPIRRIPIVPRSAYEALERELAHYINKYRFVELANAEITRNDHVTFGSILEQRDQARAELAASKNCVRYQAGLIDKDDHRAALLREMIEEIKEQK